MCRSMVLRFGACLMEALQALDYTGLYIGTAIGSVVAGIVIFNYVREM